MSLKDFTRLKGLIALTASDNDHEALSSIRAANRLLVSNGLTWEMVWSRSVTVLNEVLPAPVNSTTRSKDDNKLDAAFEAALDDANGSFRDTLLSIRGQYETTGRLSARQREMVMDAADRAAANRPDSRYR